VAYFFWLLARDTCGTSCAGGGQQSLSLSAPAGLLVCRGRNSKPLPIAREAGYRPGGIDVFISGPALPFDPLELEPRWRRAAACWWCRVPICVDRVEGIGAGSMV